MQHVVATADAQPACCLHTSCFAAQQLLNPVICSALIVCCLQNLSKDPEARRWYVQAELVHCRTAMVGAAGILLPAVSTSSSCSSSRRGRR